MSISYDTNINKFEVNMFEYCTLMKDLIVPGAKNAYVKIHKLMPYCNSDEKISNDTIFVNDDECKPTINNSIKVPNDELNNNKELLENEKVNDNVFKVQRKNESVEMKVDGDNIREPDNITSVHESQSSEYKKVADDDDIKIEVKEVEEDNKFPSQEEMMNAISNTIKQTHEMNKYDHYEEEYEHLYDEEDNMRNKGKNTKGWK